MFHPCFWRFAPEPWPWPTWKCDPPGGFWGWGIEWEGSPPLKMAGSLRKGHFWGKSWKLGAYTVSKCLTFFSHSGLESCRRQLDLLRVFHRFDPNTSTDGSWVSCHRKGFPFSTSQTPIKTVLVLGLISNMWSTKNLWRWMVQKWVESVMDADGILKVGTINWEAL
jgi:hypothetical protein